MTIPDASVGATLAGNLVDTNLRSAGTGKLSQSGAAPTKTPYAATGSSPAQDATRLSGLGSLLAAASTDDVRTDRVDALRAAIHAGTYSVSATNVADKILRNMLG
jgi:flagellar biosynthesis anti-sigma factor FlgM